MSEALASGTTSERKVRVFLSYSRKDKDLMRSVAMALQTRGYPPPIFDQAEQQHDDPDLQLTAQDEWWLQLKTMIAACDVMVFLVSPDSATSRVCDDEIAYAKSLGKRVIGVECRPIDYDNAPERLRALNVKLRISASNSESFESTLADLCMELDTNVDWRRRGAHWARLADRWASDNRAEGKVLPLGEIEDADRWAATRPANEPEPGELVQEFLDASRKKARENRERLHTITGRAFVKPAEQAFAEGRYDTALRLIAAGTLLSEDFNMLLVPERVRSLGLAADRQSLICVMRGHRSYINCVAYDRDGQRIITASQDQSARIWNAVDGTEISTLNGHEGYVSSAAFSPDGRLVVTASVDRTARIWDAATGRALSVLRHPKGDVSFAVFSPGGTRVVTAPRGDAARVWDVASGTEIVTLVGQEYSSDISFSADGRQLLTASEDKVARLWDASSGQELVSLKGHETSLTCAQFSPDGTRVLTASGNVYAPQGDNSIRVWDIRNGRQRTLMLGHTRMVRTALFSPDGTHVVSASDDGTARLWDAETGREVAVLRHHDEGVRSATFCPDGTRVVTAGHDACIWDARPHATDQRKMKVLKRDGDISAAVFSRDGARVLTGSRDGTAQIWDASRDSDLHRHVRTLAGHGAEVTSATFDCGATRLLTGCNDATARLWDVASGQQIASLLGHEGAILDASFSPDGAFAVTVSTDMTGRVWDVVSGRTISILRGHEHVVRNVSFSPDSKRVVTASNDMTARVWDAQSGAELAVLRGHKQGVRAASFSQDGRQVVSSSSDNSIRLWDVETAQETAIERGTELSALNATFSRDRTRFVGRCLKGELARVCDASSGREIALLQGHKRAINTHSFSNDGTRVVTSSDDHTARIWDAVSGREITVLFGHEAAVHYSRFSEDGMLIVTASKDHTARLWDVSRTVALAGDPIEILAASLTNGRGRKSEQERADFLMQTAPDDLYDALMERLMPSQRTNVERRAELLLKPLHPNCYVPATSSSAHLTPETTGHPMTQDKTVATRGPTQAQLHSETETQAIGGNGTAPSRGVPLIALLVLLILASCGWFLTIGVRTH